MMKLLIDARRQWRAHHPRVDDHRERDRHLWILYDFFPWRMRRVLLRKLIEDPVKYTKHRTDQEYKNLWQFTKIYIDILIILTRTIAHSPEWQLKIKWLQTSTDSKLKFKSYLYRETISSWIDAIQLKDNRFFREVVKKVENIFSKKKKIKRFIQKLHDNFYVG